MKLCQLESLAWFNFIAKNVEAAGVLLGEVQFLTKKTHEKDRVQ